jgi:hypothetical protein
MPSVGYMAFPPQNFPSGMPSATMPMPQQNFMGMSYPPQSPWPQPMPYYYPTTFAPQPVGSPSVQQQPQTTPVFFSHFQQEQATTSSSPSNEAKPDAQAS